MPRRVGGGRNTVPKPGTDLPEITDASKLQAYMKFYNLLGHGAMYPGQHNVFLVPENTWILFVTRASEPADKRKSGTLRNVLDNFYFLRKGETIAQWHQRIYDGMVDGTLFSEILYQNNAEDKFSIYEPGDLIQDLTLQFHNESWPLMRLGIWKCPMSTDVKEYLDIINNSVEIAKYDGTLKRILETTLPGFATEKPQLASAITKIINFIKDFSKITMESSKAFSNDAEVNAALQDKAIEKTLGDALQIIQSSAASDRARDNQYYFFQMNENMLEYSPSATDVKQNSRGKITKLLESTLYTLLNEKQFMSKKNRANPNPSVSDDLLLQTPKYRFIVVDACRSIEAIGKVEALYAKRAALTRRLSVSVRHQVCMNSLIQLNRRRFAELVAGKTIGPTSPVARLLAGENVALPEFEASLVSSPSEELRNVLGRPFKRGDEVFFLHGAIPTIARVNSANLNNSGKLFYIIELSTGQQVRVPAAKVYRNILNVGENILAKDLEAEARAEAEDVELNRAAKARQRAIQEKVAEKRLVKQKSEWDIQYSRHFTNSYSDPTTKQRLIKSYSARAPVGTYRTIQKESGRLVKAGNSLTVKTPYVKNGKLGYIVYSGADEIFMEAPDVNEFEERQSVRSAINSRFPVDKRFYKSTLVKIDNMTGRGDFLNGKIGRVIGSEVKKVGGTDTAFYKVQVVVDVNGTPTNKIYSIKGENLEKAPEGSVFEFQPVPLVSDYTKLVLSPEQEAAILAEATAEVDADVNVNVSSNFATGGRSHRKTTRRPSTRRRQTKRRASKH
jgi:hypothetical protein